ncbi:MAG TPA: LysR family transcriptional regulator [Magnetospirillum sp.]|nr:LysR family transcriptional regulator [Magnetospirillum sp.]
MNYLVTLPTFLETYRAGSLTKAARRLGITQPAASAHIAALESALGKPLFVRLARGVTPTAAADELARSVAAPLDGIAATMTAAQARSDHLAGTLHLIGPAEYLSARVVPALAPLVAQGLRLRVQTGNRERIYAALHEGLADLAVTASPPDDSRHGSAELGRERLLLVASPAMASRVKGREISAALLREHPCLAYDETLPLIRQFFAAVFGESAEMRAAVTAPDLRILIGMVRADMGWSVVPDYLCAEHLAAGTLAELPTAVPAPDNRLFLAWNKGALRHPRVALARSALLQRS